MTKSSRYRLWGTPGSLYTGKARAYLIKQGIDFENRAAGEARFREEIVPEIGRWIIPVLETPDGQLVQDGSEIIAHIEAAGLARHPAYPAGPRHRLIGQIFELFGGEGLLRPAMHYRWNFDPENRSFLERDFSAALAPPFATDALRTQIFEMAAMRMRKAMAGFGVSEASIPAIETAYAEFLRLFDDHLAAQPYLLGGAPCIGDYGLVAPLYAHLSRDPKPAMLMKQSAHRVWRWVERMHAPDADAGEYGSPEEALIADDDVPQTLKALLRFVAEDYLPEIEAYVAFSNIWLSERPDLPAGSSGLPRSEDRVIGRTEFIWRGHPIRVAVMPYRLYLLQKIQDVYDATAGVGRSSLDMLLSETGLERLVTLRTARRVVRRDHLEVWAAAGT